MKLKLLLKLFGWLLLQFVISGIAIGGLQLFKDRHIIEGVESLVYLAISGISIYVAGLVAIIIYNTTRGLYEEVTKK